MTELKIWFGPP